MKFKKSYFAIIFVILLFISFLFFVNINKSNIALKIYNNNNLVWELKSSSKYKNFIVFHNGNKTYETSDFIYELKSLVDSNPPEKVEKIYTKYTDEEITLTWDVPMDNGTSNTFKVQLVDDNKNVKDNSNSVSIHYSSNVKNYELIINGKVFTTNAPTLTINRNELKDENLSVEIKTYDNSGNFSSNTINNVILNYSLNVYANNDEITIENKDKTQSYNYYIKYNDSVYNLHSDKFKISDVFLDTTPPKVPTMFTVDRKLGPSKISWKEIEDEKSTISFSIHGEGNKFNNTVMGEISNVEIPPSKVYYRFSLTSEPEEVTKSTSKSSLNYMDVTFSNNTYYFNIACEDEFGNLSKTFSKKIYIKSKEETLKDIILKGDNVNKIDYSNYYEFAKRYIPLNILLLLDEAEIKIHILNEDIDKIYETIAKSKANYNIAGFYSKSSNEIFIGVNNENYTILHEIAHALDSELNDISGSEEFNKIFEEEKSNLFTSPNDPLDDYFRTYYYEYFAQCIVFYFTDSEKLENSAPKTFKFIEDLVNSI